MCKLSLWAAGVSRLYVAKERKKHSPTRRQAAELGSARRLLLAPLHRRSGAPAAEPAAEPAAMLQLALRRGPPSVPALRSLSMPRGYGSTPSRRLQQLVKSPTASEKLDRWGNPYYGDWARTGKTKLAEAAAPAAAAAGAAPAAAASPAPPAAPSAAVVDATVEHDVLNSGSTARDHLANERTFLAWARTGLGFVALGVGLAQMSVAGDATPQPPSALLERAQSRGAEGSTGDSEGANVYSSAWSANAASGKVAELMLVGVGGMVSNIDGFCIENEELCIKNEEFCNKDDKLCSFWDTPHGDTCRFRERCSWGRFRSAIFD